MTTSTTQKDRHLDWLMELTTLPTAAGREGRVIRWVENWTARRKNLSLKRDKLGNLIITRDKRGRGGPKPLYITAHLDHPAFVIRRVDGGRTVELEFRGGVQSPYFEDARIELFSADDKPHEARITAIDESAKPFKRITAELARTTDALEPGDIGRWIFENDRSLPAIRDGRLYTHACDDLAAVAAALATLDVLRNRKGMEHVGVMLTRAEEVGLIGAIAASRGRSVPKSSRLICLENSRSFPESPIGGGPILRVGDRRSVFSPDLTNRLGDILTDYQSRKPEFTWQRKLMPGGSCEATTFSTYGYASTCICLPLGNYHNMGDVEAVLEGKRPAKVAPEYIAIDDYHGMIDMLIICAERLDSAKVPSLYERMEDLYKQHGFVLNES